MTPQKARDVLASDGVTLDDLLIVYGRIQSTIYADFVFRQLVNTNYTDEPVRGGTVRVRRMKSAVSQDYGTARAAGEGNSQENNGVDVKVDTDKEIAEEVQGKDKQLYFEEGALAYLNTREMDYAIEMANTLEEAYFNELQLTASEAGLVTVSGGSDTKDKLSILIRELESVSNENVKNVNVRDMVLTLAPEWYDELEDYLVTLANPFGGGQDVKSFRGVPVLRAVRQDFDAIVQHRGALAQPVVMDKFKIGEIPHSNDIEAYMSYYFGTEAVMPDLVLACALDEDISA